MGGDGNVVGDGRFAQVTVVGFVLSYYSTDMRYIMWTSATHIQILSSRYLLKKQNRNARKEVGIFGVYLEINETRASFRTS